MRRSTTLLLAFSALALPASAHAQSEIQTAAESLRTDPVYVDPEAADKVSPAQERRLEALIAEKRAGPMYIAVLPASALSEAGGDPSGVAREIANTLQRQGVYAVGVGNQFAAGQ